MRIAYITTDFGIPVHGNKGASIHVRELSSAMVAEGHHVEIFTSRAGGDRPRGFDVPVHELRLTPVEREMIAALKDDPFAGEAVAKETRSMLYATSFRHQALPLMRAMRPDAIHERYALLGTAGATLAKDLGIPHILEVNAPLSDEHANHRGTAYAQALRAMERHILAAADRIVAVSDPIKRWIVDSGVDHQRVAVVPNGVDLSRFAPDARRAGTPRDPGTAPVVGFVGTLKAWHGTATLIRAVARLARDRGIHLAPRLLIVGDGPERARLEMLAAAEGIRDLVAFRGMVPHADIPAHIAAMDIAVAPYDAVSDFYFSPLKLFEYMAAGRPIVTARIGQIQDCIEHGETGLLYPPGNIDALARSIACLLDEPDRARSLGAAAREAALQRHGWSHNARAVERMIREELDRKHPSEREKGAAA